MFETQLAKDENHELKKVSLPENFKIISIKVKYEEFPDRNTFIHGLEMLGKDNEQVQKKVVDETFAHYRGREDTFNLDEGQQIIGIQVNTQSHHDHISRLGFVVWGNSEHMRKTKKFKESKASKDFCKDILMNFIFLLFSFVPLGVALFFIKDLSQHIDRSSQWLTECDQAEQSSIINRLEWNKIYYITLAGATILRFPQWFCQGVNFFRKIAIWMWLAHVLLVFFHLATIWMVNSVINDDTCSDAVLNNKDTFGWHDFRK